MERRGLSLVLDPSLQAYPLRESLEESIKDSRYIPDSSVEIRLSYTDGILRLDSKLFPNVYCDFLNKKYLKEVKQSYGRREGVYSFIPSKQRLKICDLTVGMGKDLFKFVLAGHVVTGFERNPIFYHMVLNGIERFQRSDETQPLKELFKVEEFKVELKFGESKPGEERYDLVYFDPMFEDVSKKAAPKKGMQALKNLTSQAEENEKFETIKKWAEFSEKLVYKCSGRPVDFPFRVKKETKGKGFSYITL